METASTGLLDSANVLIANTGLTKEQRLFRIGLKGIGIGMGMIGGALGAISNCSRSNAYRSSISISRWCCIIRCRVLLESGESYVSRKLGLGYE